MKYDCELNLEDRNSLSILISRIKPNSIVLEFGPANGRMTKYMKEQLNCKVFAVEIDEQSAKDAAQYTEKIIVDSIENYTWKEEFENIKFDYIIFADVLEHLYYPEKVLLNAKEFLKEDGSVLVSIPNIAHNSIIINLLKNEFNYNPTGLLDNTHIRFFTKKTFDELINNCKLFSSMETGIFIKPEDTEFHNSYIDLPEKTANYLKSLYFGEVYQFVYELKKYKCEITSDFLDEYKSYSQYFIRLLIEQDDGIIVKNFIKVSIPKNNEIQIVNFNLETFKNLKRLFLYPLNHPCVIEIESISLISENGERELINFISSNSIIKHGKSYFFDKDDSCIYFEGFQANDFIGVQKLIVKVKFVHIGKDALQVCLKQAICDKKFIEEKVEQMSNRLNKLDGNVLLKFLEKYIVGK